MATFSAVLRADEAAKRVTETARSSMTQMTHGEMRITSRRVTVMPGREPESREMQSSTVQRLIVTWRAPGDWRFVFQREMGGSARSSGGATYVFAKVGEDAAMLTLNSADNERVEMKLPAKIFFQEARQRVGMMMGLPVLGWIPNWPSRSSGSSESTAMPEQPVAKADELVDGVWCERVDGVTPQMRISLWVDKRTKLLVRSRETRDLREGFGMRPFVDITENVYSYAREKGEQTADFDLQGGWSLAQPGLSTTPGFGSTAELAAWVREISPSSDEGGSVAGGRPPSTEEKKPDQPLKPDGAPVAGGPGSGKKSADKSKNDAPTEAQLLDAGQMAAIVLVEGEEGVGTGFVTKIRDLPFIVTNLHVIGGNEKLRVTTLTGAKIEVGAIHGALGRDLAILRVEGAAPAAFLKLCEDPLQTAKIGDKVVVVGNRRGGGVATQVSGSVQGIGPDRVEVNAAFQPGNSGSPIVHVASGEVIGLAAYSQTRKLDVLDGVPAKTGNAKDADDSKVEQRWFGYRIDGVKGWQAVDLARWRQQAKRIEAFREESEALYYALLGKFTQAKGSPGVQRVVERFEQRFERSGAAQVQIMQDVAEYFRSLRALTDNGKKELRDGDYYDYFRSSLYWETSIPEQIRMRDQIAKYLDQAADHSTAFLSRLRN